MEHHKEHTACVDTFVQFAKQSGKDIKIKLDSELNDTDGNGVDLIIALGGDHTYLKASSLAKTSQTPVLGIDTSEAFAHSVLSGNAMNFKHSKENAEKILKALDQPDKRQF